ncbi:MAG: transposase [Methanophagales archaeon]|nr:transposase [Methanophagales archaeon]
MNIRYTRGNRVEVVKEHRFVNHSKEYAKDGVHVNTAENRHGFLRAWLIKFRGVSKHYLRNYISFFELLFNSKKTSIHHSVPDGLGG